MKYEEILDAIDGFGKYQKIIVFLLVVSTFPNGFFAMVSVFILDTPEHHCKIPTTLPNETGGSGMGDQSWLNDPIPFEKDGSGNWVRSSCKRIVSVGSANSSQDEIKCDHGWDYNTKFNEYTAVMEWDIVCDKAWMKPLVISLYMAGILIGSFASGMLSDRFGRRPVFLVGTLLQFISIFVTGFSNNAWTLAIAMLLSGCTALVNYVSAFVIATELVDSSKRALVGSLEIAGFTFGYMFLPVAAYFLTQWRWLMWFMGAGGVVFIPYYWWIPESPRWLAMNGKEGAREIILKIAKTNGRSINEEDLQSIDKILVADEKSNEISQQFTYVDLLRHPSIRLRSLIMFFVWFSVSAAYFCISLNTSNLGGNKFINCFVSAAVELPAYTSSYFLVQRYGRRPVLVVYLMVAGISCAAAPFFHPVSETAMIVSAMISKFSVTGVFSLIYIYCCELFPTKMRNMGIGASSTVARFGGMLSPYLIYAGERLSRYIPYLVLGGLAVASALVTLLLPETLGIPLPESIDDAVKQDRFKLACCHSSSHDEEESDEKDLAEKCETCA